jgi:hypothetical protein
VLVHAGEKGAAEREETEEARASCAPPVAYRQAWRERSRMAAAALAAFCFFSASLSEHRNRRMLNKEQVLCKKIKKKRSICKNFHLNVNIPILFVKNPTLLKILIFTLKLEWIFFV